MTSGESEEAVVKLTIYIHYKKHMCPILKLHWFNLFSTANRQVLQEIENLQQVHNIWSSQGSVGLVRQAVCATSPQSNQSSLSTELDCAIV